MRDRREIFLIRHGEAVATWGQSADPGLSERGREQARTVAATLPPRLASKTATLISSPLQRAQETAAPLAQLLGADVRIDERFREIPSPVPLHGRQAWLREFMRGRWSEQEKGLHVWRRAILDALQDLPDGSVVFTHFLVINTVAGHLEARDETLVYWPANASISVLRSHGSGWSVERGEVMRSHVN